jgi:hypothetical protein
MRWDHGLARQELVAELASILQLGQLALLMPLEMPLQQMVQARREKGRC